MLELVASRSYKVIIRNLCPTPPFSLRALECKNLKIRGAVGVPVLKGRGAWSENGGDGHRF